MTDKGTQWRKNPASRGSILLLGMAFSLIVGSSCVKPNPLQSALQERMQYEVKLLSWAIMEGQTIAASVNISGPMKSSLKHLTIRFDQHDDHKNIIRTDWIPFDLSELKGIGAKDFMLTLECGSPAVTLLTAKVEYQPSPEDMKRIKELDGLL